MQKKSKDRDNMFSRAGKADFKRRQERPELKAEEAAVAPDRPSTVAVENSPSKMSPSGITKYQTDRVFLAERDSAADKEMYLLKQRDTNPICSARFKFNRAEAGQAEVMLSQRRERVEPESGGTEGQEAKEESLCQICFTNDACAVLLDCGHGGICLDCAIDAMKKNNSCIFCREKVLQIIEIDMSGNNEAEGVYKVLNSFLVTDSG